MAALQFRLQDFCLPFIFVPDINVSPLRASHQRGKNHALDNEIRKALQDEPILNGAWLALIGVADAHISQDPRPSAPHPI